MTSLLPALLLQMMLVQRLRSKYDCLPRVAAACCGVAILDGLQETIEYRGLRHRTADRDGEEDLLLAVEEEGVALWLS